MFRIHVYFGSRKILKNVLLHSWIESHMFDVQRTYISRIFINSINFHRMNRTIEWLLVIVNSLVNSDTIHFNNCSEWIEWILNSFLFGLCSLMKFYLYSLFVTQLKFNHQILITFYFIVRQYDFYPFTNSINTLVQCFKHQFNSNQAFDYTHHGDFYWLFVLGYISTDLYVFGGI